MNTNQPVYNCRNNVLNQRNCSNLFHEWKFGTLNVRSGKEKLEGARIYAIAKEVERANLSFCCLQEVRHRKTGKKLITLDSGVQYSFLWCGQKKRRDAGVGILIKSERAITFSDPDVNDPRVMALNINVHGFKTRVVIGYSPTNTNESETLKDEFYRNMKKACDLCLKHHKLIIAGDFNAETSLVYSKSEFDGTKVAPDDLCNGNGLRLKSFSRRYKLCMPQTFFIKPLIKRHTWYSSDGKTIKILDYVLLQRFVNQFVTDCEVCNEYKFESDHRLLVTSLTTPRNKKSRWKPKTVPKLKLNINLLKEDLYKTEFAQKSTACLNARPSHDSSPEAISNRIIETLNEAASAILPYQNAKKVNQIWKNDEEFNDLLVQKSNAMNPSPEYSKICRSINSRVRKLRNEKLRKEAEEINTFATKRDIEQMYKSFKDDGSTFKRIRCKDGCDPQVLKKYFENHFKKPEHQDDPLELTNAPDFIAKLKRMSKSTTINCEAPTKSEVIHTLKTLKNGKASNDLPAIYLKSAIESPEVVDEIVKLYNTVWLTELIPQKWCHSKLITIWKGRAKGSADDPSTYRGIQIGSTFCKILVVIILERIREWYEKQISDQQQGFRRGRGTCDGIHIIKRIQQISYRSKKQLFVLFVDLSAAFDHVNRDWLFKSIYQRLPRDQSQKLFKLLESVYSFTTTALSGNDEDIFNVLTGVRQGGPESPTLYNLYMDYVMRVFLEECKSAQILFTKFKYKIPAAASTTIGETIPLGKYGVHEVTWVGYADDIVLAFDDPHNLEKALHLLDATFKRFQLNINATKTETMILNFSGTEEEYPKSFCQLNGSKIKNVKLFKYLGASVVYNKATTGETEINQRIDSAEAKFYEHSKKLTNFKISLRTRVSVLNAIVRSRLSYGCQVWTLSAELWRRVNSFYCGLLRRMVRGGFSRRDNSMAFKLSNSSLLRIGGTESMDAFIDRQQRKYLAHIIRHEDDSTVKKLTFNDDEVHVPGPYYTLRSTVLKRETTDEATFYRRCTMNLI